MDKINEADAMKALEQRETQSQVSYDTNNTVTPEPAPTNLGMSEASKAVQTRMEQPAMAGADGWKMVPVENTPSKGWFYPDGIEIAIKAATVGDVRQFSLIDENDPLSLDDKLNVIMDKCVRIKFKDRMGSYRDLKEEDRFFLIFAIRDLTFITGENKLFLNIKCGIKCLGDGSFFEKLELRSDNFEYYKISDEVMRFFDSEKKCFVLPFKDGPVELYVPSLGITTFVKNFVRERMQKQEWFDQTFMKVASFMFSDYRLLTHDRYIAKQQESMAWGIEKLSAILKATEMIRFGAKTEITRECNKCGAEVAAPLTFPGGIRSLFLISDPLAGLG